MKGSIFFGFFGRFPASEGVGKVDAYAFAAFFGERCAKILEEEADLKVGDDEGGGKDFEAENTFLRGFFQVGGEEGVFATLRESFVNFLEDFHEVGAGSAAGVEDIDVFVREAIGETELFTEDGVHTGDHVLDDFGRGVPNTEVLAEFRVKGLQEGLVEILDGVGLLKLGKERSAVHAIEDRGGPIENFREVEVFEVSGIGDFVKKLAEDGYAEEAGSGVPVEALS